MSKYAAIPVHKTDCPRLDVMSEDSINKHFAGSNGMLDTQDRAIIEFAQALRKAMPGVEFVKTNVSMISVYYPGDMFAMGKIGYGDFSTGDTPWDYKKFVVVSRTITNDKYHPRNPLQFHMKATLSLDTAIANAKRHLRRFTPMEDAAEFTNVLVTAFNQKRMAARMERDQAVSKLFGVGYMEYKAVQSPAAAILTRFMKAGYLTEYPEETETLKVMLEASAMLSDGTKHSFKFAYLTERYAEQCLAVVPITDVNPDDCKVLDDVKYYRVDSEIPDDMVGQLSVLQMCEPEQFIDGVGVRAAENAYFVLDVLDVPSE